MGMKEAGVKSPPSCESEKGAGVKSLPLQRGRHEGHRLLTGSAVVPAPATAKHLPRPDLSGAPVGVAARLSLAVEYATLEWVDWFNNHRLLESIGNIPPAEAETRYYASQQKVALAA